MSGSDRSTVASISRLDVEVENVDKSPPADERKGLANRVGNWPLVGIVNGLESVLAP